MHCQYNTQRMLRPVEEVWITKGDVGCSSRNLTTNILENDLRWEHKEPATVHRRYRTMRTEVQTAATGLHIAGNAAVSLML